MHKTDPVLNFTYVAMNGTRKKDSDLLDYYLSDKRPRVPIYSKSRFKGKSNWITLSRCEGFAYILRLTSKTLFNIVLVCFLFYPL